MFHRAIPSATLEELGTDQLSVRLFWSKVKQDADHRCWTWTGAKYGSGYGLFVANSKRYTASRYSWMLANLQPVPPGMKGRMRSGWNKVRVWRAGATNGRSKLTEAQVREIRTAAAAGRVNKEALGRQYGVNGQTIHAVISRRIWRHLD